MPPLRWHARGPRLRLVAIPALHLAYVIFMGNDYRADQLKPLFAVQRLIHEAVR